MQKNNLRLISSEEIRKINAVIRPRFGNNNRIVSGSCELYDSERKRCNIVLPHASSYKSDAMLRRIGRWVKVIMGVHEVYYFGVKIA